MRAVGASVAALVVLAGARARAEPFGGQGEVIVSADRLAQAIVVEHATSGDATTNVVAIGESLRENPIERSPRLGLDVAFFPHVTLGVAGSYGHSDAELGSSAWIVAPRVGVAVPFGGRIGFWPRVGLEHAEIASRTRETRDHLVLETEVALFVAGRGAITTAPIVEVPLSDRGGTRFTFTAGMLARLGGDDPSKTPPRFGSDGEIILSAERIAPIASYTKQVRAPTPRGDDRELALGPSHAFDRGAPSRAGLGLDVVLGDGFTFGGTLGLDLVPWEEKSSPDPNDTSGHGIKLGISPRLGWIGRLGDSAAFWFRAGLTYVAALAYYDRIGAPRAHELDFTIEPLFVFFPVPGAGITVGPSASTTAWAADAGPRAPLDEVGSRVVAISATGGIVLAF
jgi:hypothetical protein